MHLIGIDGVNFRSMGEYHEIEMKVQHPDFSYKHVAQSASDGDNDIGLVKTKTPITALPPMNQNTNWAEPTDITKRSIYLYGWGGTEKSEAPTMLSRTEVTYATDIDECQQSESVKAGRLVCFKMRNKGVAVGKGESGGPFVFEAMSSSETDFVGVILAGTDFKVTEESAAPEKDRLYWTYGPNISYYLSWIDGEISK